MTAEQVRAPTINPKVSICIPTYNRAWCLKEAIDCALSQDTSSPYEILIVDNASTDDTPTLVQSYVDPRIRYERNPTNIGIVPNWNRCLELARGEYLTIWSDDDLVTPDFVSKHVAVMEAHHEVGLVYSACQFATLDGKIFEEVWPFPESHVWSGNRELEFMTRRSYILCPPMMRRQHLDRVGRMNTQMVGTQDWEWWIRFACHGSVAYIAKIFYTKRYHTRQTGDMIYMGYDQAAILAVWEEWCSFVEVVLRDAPYLDRRSRTILNARRYCEIAKVELGLALSALRQNNLGEFRRALGRFWHWQITKAGWRYVPQTLWDALMFFRKRLQGRTKYVFDFK